MNWADGHQSFHEAFARSRGLHPIRSFQGYTCEAVLCWSCRLSQPLSGLLWTCHVKGRRFPGQGVEHVAGPFLDFGVIGTEQRSRLGLAENGGKHPDCDGRCGMEHICQFLGGRWEEKKNCKAAIRLAGAFCCVLRDLMLVRQISLRQEMFLEACLHEGAGFFHLVEGLSSITDYCIDAF